MLTVSLKNSYDFSMKQIEASHMHAQCYEIRLDTFKSLKFEEIEKLVSMISVPFILTLRKVSQGGWFSNDLEKRIELLKTYLTLNPDYVDLEFDTPPSVIKEVRSLAEKTKVILSYHDFHSTPRDLEALFIKVFKESADEYKFVTTATCAIDALRMVEFVLSKNAQGLSVTGITMGKSGEISRILAPVIGCSFNYSAANNDTSRPHGQLFIDDLIRIYNANSCTDKTKVYVLIGNPTAQSISHVSHNRVFQTFNLNAVYLKIDVLEEEVSQFLEITSKLCIFQGVSITVPHKETVYKHLSNLTPQAEQIGSVNTLYKESGEWKGTNTDALGALDALETKCKASGKTILILGAGGTARAIAFEARKRGANLFILNRTKEKAEDIAKNFGGEAFGYNDLQRLFSKKVDIVLNTTVLGMAPNESKTAISPIYLSENMVVMDVIFTPKMTLLLKEAKDKNCTLVLGYEMFIYQAIEQFSLWFPGGFQKEKASQIIEDAYSEIAGS